MAAVSFSPSLRPLVASTSRISSTSSRSFHVTPHARSVEAYARIRPAATHRSRYLAHYQNTLAPDLLYMTYDHQNTQRPPEPPALPSWDSENPHTKNRSRPRIKTALTPAPRPTTDRNLIQIESLTLSIHVKQAAANKNHLLPAIMFLRAISGLPAAGLPQSHLGKQHPTGVEIVRSRAKSASFKIRSGLPVGAKVTIKDPAAIHDFLETVSELVMPRLKDWNGVPLLPPTRGEQFQPNYHSGALTFGLPAQAMGLFPQVEVNLDAYPRQFGLAINVNTNAVGAGAQDRVRTLLSGFKIPFVTSA